MKLMTKFHRLFCVKIYKRLHKRKSNEKEAIIIAWFGNRWVETAERAEIIATYREYKEALDSKYPDVGEMDSDTMADYLAACKELARLERIHRCERDLLEFSIEYFSEAKNPGNAGNWEGFDVTHRDQAAQFHKEICDIMNEVSTTKPNAKTAVAAPRSHAKSSYLTKAFPLHETVFRKRKYIIIISETPSVSGPNLEWLATQLKHNEKLRADFGPLLSVKQQENPKDNNAEFIAWEPKADGNKRQLTKVEAASTGQALRGRNWNGSRPDLVVCDDLEDAKTNAATEEQRTKLREWFQSVVMPLGDPKGAKTATVYMGTTVHWESLLMHILYKRSDFTTKIYRAIVEQPERGDLWEQCREIYVNRENKNRLDEAVAFYEANWDEMNRGSVVLWPEVQPIWKLMTWKWDNGSKAFNTEYQNNPVDEESMVFNPATFTYWDDTDPTRQFPHNQYVVSMGVDFAMGKERGDYSALTVTAKHKESGVYYVIDSFIERLHPDDYMKVIADKTLKWQPDVIGVEAQMAQEFFVDHLKSALQHVGYPAHNRVKKIYQRSRKELRIESMLPDIETKKIQFCRKHAILLEQFERYGSGSHDDGPDSCEISVRSSKQAKRQLQDKPAWL